MSTLLDTNILTRSVYTTRPVMSGFIVHIALA